MRTAEGLFSACVAAGLVATLGGCASGGVRTSTTFGVECEQRPGASPATVRFAARVSLRHANPGGYVECFDGAGHSIPVESLQRVPSDSSGMAGSTVVVTVPGGSAPEITADIVDVDGVPTGRIVVGAPEADIEVYNPLKVGIPPQSSK